MSYEAVLVRIRDVLHQIKAASDNTLIMARTVYVLLNTAVDEVSNASESVLVANVNIAILEEVILGKGLIAWNKAIQSVLVILYSKIFEKAPGYAVRNIVTNLMSIATGTMKGVTVLPSSKECSILILNTVVDFPNRFNDIFSMYTNIVQGFTKLIKSSSETYIKVAVLTTWAKLIDAAGAKMIDLVPDIIKVSSKYLSDKAYETRVAVATIFTAIATSTISFNDPNAVGSTATPLVSIDSLLTLILKGLDDDVTMVQEAYAAALASLLSKQSLEHLESIKEAKLDMARGTKEDPNPSNSDKSQKKSSFSTMSMRQSLAQKLQSSVSAVVSSNKFAIENYDVHTVIGYIIKQILTLKISNNLRSAYLLTLKNVIAIYFNRSSFFEDVVELEWLVNSLLVMLRDPSTNSQTAANTNSGPGNGGNFIQSLSYADVVSFRCKISYLFRVSIANKLSGSLQTQYLSVLNNYILGTDSRNEHQLQIAMSELVYSLTVLGEIPITTVEEIYSAVSIQLRSIHFGVRSTAANVIVTLGCIYPTVAVRFLRSSFLVIQVQFKNLLSSDSAIDQSCDIVDTELMLERKKNQRDIEKAQRMFYFHGHIIVVSLFLKHHKKLLTGIPKQLIFDIADFAVALMMADTASAQINNIVCSLVRAGSLIVASCLSMGYQVVRNRISNMIECCHKVLTVTPSTQTAERNNSPDSLLYEVMIMEAALSCLSALLWSCPEAIIQEDGCLSSVVDSLEAAFRALKGKYQPKLRSQFRFRTFHASLLECFAWLPPGSFPNSSQQMFVEALRVFRDSLAAGYECNILADYVSADFGVLNISSLSKSLGLVSSISGAISASVGVTSSTTKSNTLVHGNELPLSENELILKLENNMVVLQKREHDAFLSLFSEDSKSLDTLRISLESLVEWAEPSIPCSNIDARTVNAAIVLLASLFGHQDDEYQNKAIQLCSQAIQQVVKSTATPGNSMSMFGNDEEKKKKDKKVSLIVKNVVVLLASVTQSFSLPLTISLNLSLSWGQVFAERMFELLTYNNNEIRCAAAYTFASFASKVSQMSLFEEAFNLINKTLGSSFNTMLLQATTGSSDAKKNDKHEMSDLVGYILVLSLFFTNFDSKTQKKVTKMQIIDSIFGCLHRVDHVSSSFRLHGLLALELIVRKISSDQSSKFFGLTSVEVCDIMERVCNLVELQYLAVNNSDDSDIAVLLVQRISNEAVNIIAGVLVDSINDTSMLSSSKITVLQELVPRYHGLWLNIYSTFAHPAIRRECITFLGSLVPFLSGQLMPNVPSLAVKVKIISLLKHELSTIRTLTDNVTLVQAIVDVIVLLLTKSNSPYAISRSLCKSDIGIDVHLFQLLDWCFAVRVPTLNVSYSGLEFKYRTNISDIVGNIQNLKCSIEGILFDMAKLEVDTNINNRLVRWILLCRTIALGLRGNGAGTSTVQKSNHDDDDEEHAAVTEEFSNATSEICGTMTYGEYATYVHDTVIGNCSVLVPCRLDTKHFAIQLANFLITRITSTRYASAASPFVIGNNSIDEAHFNIALARKKTVEALQHVTKDATGHDIPVYLALFINEIITFACSCAIFTLGDSYVVKFQAESVTLLARLLRLFWDTVDPDSNVEDNTTVVRMITQFTPQLVTAIRPGLNTRWVPSILQASSLLLSDIIEDGILSDKTIIRRLLNNVVSTLEQRGLHAGGASLAVKNTEDVGDNINIADNLVSLLALARLFNLTAPGSILDSTAKDLVSEVLMGSVTTVVNTIYNYIIDSVRIMQTFHSDIYSVSDEVAKHIIRKPDENKEADARRGGITYSPHVEPYKICKYFKFALPNFLAAVTYPELHHLIQCYDINFVFELCKLELEDLFAGIMYGGEFKLSFDTHDGSTNLAYEFLGETPEVKIQLLLQALSSLARITVDRVNTQADVDVHTDSWCSLLSFFCNIFMPKLSMPLQREKYPLLFVRHIVNIVSVLGELSGESHGSKLWSWLWTTCILLLHTLFPVIFDSSADASVIRNNILSGIYPAVSDLSSIVDALSSDSSSFFSSNYQLYENSLVNIGVMLDNNLWKSENSMYSKVATMVSAVTRSQCVAYSSQIQCALIPLTALAQRTRLTVVNKSLAIASLQESTLNALKTMYVCLLITLQNNYEELGVIIGNSLLQYQRVCTQVSVTGNTKVEDVLYTIIHSYVKICLDLRDTTTTVGLPVQWCAIILQDPASLFTSIFLKTILAFMREDASRYGAALANTCLPAVISILMRHATSTVDAQLELVMIQVLFEAFNITDIDQKNTILYLLLQVSCSILVSGKNSTNMHVLCKGLTNVARVYPDRFKEQVVNMNDAQRTILQDGMKNTMTQASSCQQNKQMPALNIDYKRFK